MKIVFRSNPDTVTIMTQPNSIQIGADHFANCGEYVLLAEQLCDAISRYGILNHKLEVIDIDRTEETGLLLYCLLRCGNSFFCSGVRYDLTFAYAMPLYRDSKLMDYVEKNLRNCIKNNQLVPLPHDTLYSYPAIAHEKLARMEHQERRTIKKNQATKVKEIPFSEVFFLFWKEYDLVRFREVQSEDFAAFFHDVYSLEGFRLYEFSNNGHILAYNVCYYDDVDKIIYDVLLPWNWNQKSFRVGIYSALINLRRAQKLGWGYSLCYGKFPYKDQLFRCLED